MNLDEHYLDPRLAELYDHDSPWSHEREFYRRLSWAPSKPPPPGGEDERPQSEGPKLADAGPRRILDLGCGTGLLCDTYAADGHAVTGVDPAEAMLEVARRKPHGSDIDWVRSTAQAFRSATRFDLIVMTGNAFQVLLDEAAVRATFEVMRSHLAPGGTIAFETRNPALDWPSRWDYRIELKLPAGLVRESRRFVSLESGVMTFEFQFDFPDETLRTTSRIRFWSREEVECALRAANLRVRELSGGWDGRGFDAASTEEMVLIVEAG